ncbi:MAG: hypothetical protein M3447_00025 [Acidobacteriota bacterium]|nr:hypothetical protein [Acidobacteriota bacterium]
MKRRVVVLAWMFAGMLGLLAGIRDIYAPGFFNISPLIKSNADIVLQFVAAAMMFVCAALMSRTRTGWPER